MRTDERAEFETRDAILTMLSDQEVGSVSTAEAASHLSSGEEYLDLEELDRGVQVAHGASVPMGRVLPRRAVRELTWNKILTKLAVPVS